MTISSDIEQQAFDAANKNLFILEELARQLEVLPIGDRLDRWRQCADEEQAAVLPLLRVDPRRALFAVCNDDELLKIGLHLTGSELADVFEELPEQILSEIVKHLDKERRALYQTLARFETDEVGRYVNEEMWFLPSTTSLARAQRLMRGKRLPYVEHVYIVSRNAHYEGAVSQLGLAEETQASVVNKLFDERVHVLVGNTKIEEAINALEASGFAALPVVDNEGHLIGVFTMASAMLAQRNAREALLLSTAGISEDKDLFSPLRNMVQERGLWLGINLLTAVLASLFISLFEASLEEIVALAVLMPIVASMGGITGSQTLATVIRRMALNQITPENQGLILRREVSSGLLNGVLWAALGGTMALLWFNDIRVGIALAVGLLVNISVAAWCGMTVPLLLKRLGIDPAVSGAVILTTITDIIGFVSFLGTATLMMWQLS
ncbi:MAG: magnesium transporter [Crocinitomicaceae bacterium]|jgi:magnesium transporter